jgi:hypothetical protein
MGLLDTIMNASGESTPNYGKKGTYIGRLRRMRLRDPSEAGSNPELKPGFRVDIDVIFCSRSEKDFNPGDIATFTDPFKFVGTALARVRRAAANAATCKTGSTVTEATFGLTKAEGEKDEDFTARVKAEIKRLLGPDQPSNGAIVKIVATEGKNQKTGTPYTLFDLEVPSEDDLKLAGLI